MIAKQYTTPQALGEIKTAFTTFQPQLVRLEHVLTKRNYSEVYTFLQNMRFIKKNIPDKFSFGEGSVARLFTIFPELDSLLRLVLYLTDASEEQLHLGLHSYGKGTYTLLHDSEGIGERTEFYVFFGPKRWDSAWGGTFVYKDAADNSILIPPQANSFCIVHKKDLQRFVQYVKHFAGDEKFYVLYGFVEQ